VSAIVPEDRYWPGAWRVQVQSDLGMFRILVGGEPSDDAVQTGDVLVVTVCRPQ